MDLVENILDFRKTTEDDDEPMEVEEDQLSPEGAVPVDDSGMGEIVERQS